MANPQPEPFVKFSKELFNALLLSPMPATHKEIVLAVIRKTYGEHGRKTAPISQQLLQRMTGRAESGIRKSLAALKQEGVLVQVSEPGFKTTAVWGLNKDYESWGRWSVDSATVIAEGQSLADPHHGEGGECHQSGTPERQSLAEGSATVVAPLKNYRTIEGGERAREEAPPDPFADVDFGEEEAEQETDPLLEFALTELPPSESSRDDYAKVLTKHRGRLHEQTIERIISELATWKPKTPRSKLHLTLNAWLLKCPNEPMPAAHVPFKPIDESKCVPMPEHLRGLFKKVGVLEAFGADERRSVPDEKASP